MSCCLIILNYMDKERAANLAIQASKISMIEHIIIADNNSPDDSYAFLCGINIDKVDVITTNKNGGFAYGNNFAAKYAIKMYKPQFILFANTDTIWHEDLIKACEQEMEDHIDLGLVSCRIKGPKNEEQMSNWKFGTFSTMAKGCLWYYKRKWYNNVYNFKKEYNSKFEYVDVVRGSFMFFRTEAIIAANFFDENTFLYAEEAIIAKRLYNVNYRVGLITNKWYVHDHVEVVKSQTNSFIQRQRDNSTLYYLERYCRISKLQSFIFKMVVKYADFETWGIRLIKKIWRK